MDAIEASCLYDRQNLMEMNNFIHKKTRKRLLLLTLAGVALLVAGLIISRSYCIFLGVLWTAFFLGYSNHTARKSTRATLKHNKKLYGGPVETTVKFYNTMLIAVNRQTENRRQVRYDEVTRLIFTQNLAVLILPDTVAVPVDLRTVAPEQRRQLCGLLTEQCTAAKAETR